MLFRSGIERGLARAHHKTFVEMLAIRAQAILARGGHMRPHPRRLGHIRQIGAVAALRAPRKTRDLLQITRVLARG